MSSTVPKKTGSLLSPRIVRPKFSANTKGKHNMKKIEDLSIIKGPSDDHQPINDESINLILNNLPDESLGN